MNYIPFGRTGIKVSELCLGTMTFGFQCDDDRSGVDTCAGDTTISDGHAGGATGTAVDRAGNSSVAVVSGIKVDTVAPTITGSLGLAKPASGWFNVAVPVNFTCADATSGVAACGPNQTIGEGENQSVSGTGAAASLATRGDPAELAPETELRFTLNSPVSITTQVQLS